MFYQDYCHGKVCQGEDIGGTNGIVTSGDGGGTTVCRDIDRLAIPPLLRLFRPMLVMLKFIFYQYG